MALNLSCSPLPPEEGGGVVGGVVGGGVVGGGEPDPGTHWEYQSLKKLVSNGRMTDTRQYPGSTYLLYWHTAPETHVVGPVQP